MVEPVQTMRQQRSEVRVAECWVVMGSEIRSSEACEFTLARKGANKAEGARTANRRRWARRGS